MHITGSVSYVNMDDTQERGVTPAQGAPLKGVQAYLGRWGLAHLDHARYTSEQAAQPSIGRKEVCRHTP